MNSFTRFVGKLPLSGKMLIRPALFGLYQSTTLSERRLKYWSLIIFFSFFVFVHGLQAALGVEALGFESPVWTKTIFGLYALVNISVVLAQISLGLRATQFFFKKGNGSFSPKRKRYINYSKSEVKTMLVVTLGGQIIFILFYTWYS
ncbi:MAG: hypothetical protein UT67_C0002G0028 [Candidatus Magasanikbacteria bacterium GW2011_GWA2_40_10]|uniref:Uncharacterized protein n=1 Tax=Candidatus Magasanikbacteria bacterium GW2011_GWA2_40_10 TaxID=1619037 RepID=A0A0G0Q4V5_9BACT|nr:MAG: hypothetical protein UT67_C0002G0028 [Candidatus Magasanikbacteria bacterium GW2011_GWA2_40_10]